MLRDVSFRVQPGQTAGHRRAIPARARQPSSNCCCASTTSSAAQILLDGVDIRELECAGPARGNSESCCRIRFFLPARWNRTCGWAPKVTARAVEARCAKWAWARSSIRCRKGVETEVTERGATLSVGQRQLVSFARALAHDPRFLILDEATSSVDTKTELMIREALDRLLHGRTAHGDRAPAEHDPARRLASWCFTRAGCASRARTRNCWGNAESITGSTNCNTRIRSCASRWRPRTKQRGPPCLRMTDRARLPRRFPSYQ